MFPTVSEAKAYYRVILLTLWASVNEHSSVHALNGDEIFSAMLVFVLVSKDHFSKRSTTTGVVYNISDNSFDVPKQLLKVHKGFDKMQKRVLKNKTYPALSA